MKILGIDQSYSCSGIVIIDDGIMTHSEVFKTDKTMELHQRAENIANYILELSQKHSPDYIGIEGLAFGMRGDATRDLAGLQFVIINKLKFKGNFKIEVVAPNAVKKFATGKGRAKKEELFEALPQYVKTTIVEDLGLKKTTGMYDVTDAYFIGRLTDITNQMK